MQKKLNDSDIFPKSIPFLYNNTYTDIVEGYLLVYQPLSKKGPAILHKAAAFYLSQIDGKKKISDIFQIAQKEDPRIKIIDVIRCFMELYSSEIIYFDKQKRSTNLYEERPKSLSVWLHITNQCNLRCRYCYVNKSNERMNDETADKALEKIFLSAIKHKIKKIQLKFSGGEPLLELTKILKLVKKAKIMGQQNNINTNFVVLTNGILITGKVAKIFKENNIRPAISLDGLEKYHNRTRIFPGGLGSFKLVKKGINNLQKVGVSFNVIVVITSKNIDGIFDLTKYLLERRIHFVFSFFRDNPDVKEKLKCSERKLIATLKKTYKYIYENLPNYRIINKLLDKVIFDTPHLHTCTMGRSYIAINHDGRLASCQMTLDSPIGSIYNKDLLDIIIKGNFIRPKGLTIDDKISCKTCQWKYICTGGCPLLTFMGKGRYDESSPYCNVYKALIPELLRLEAKRLIKFGFKASNT